jgi:hypothetical protein
VSPKRRKKGPLYNLKAAIQGLKGSRSATAEVYDGEYQYQRAVEKAEEIFFSVSTTELLLAPFADPFARSTVSSGYRWWVPRSRGWRRDEGM